MAGVHAEGVGKSVFRHVDRPPVYLSVEADNEEDARQQLGRLLLFEFEPVEQLLRQDTSATRSFSEKVES